MATEILIPGTLEGMLEDVKAALKAQGYRTTFMGSITDADVDMGQAYIDNDLCVAAIATIGQTIRYIRHHGANVALAVPEVCKDCRALSLETLLPEALERAGISRVEFVPVSCAELSSALSSQPEPELSGDKPLIGVCGNAVMLSTPQFHNTIVKHLQSAGCEAVMPPLNLMMNEQDFLEPCIEWFAQRGVKSAICVLAFGCLGGHTYARGRSRMLREKYPEVELTLLDYDPSASEINLINRTELVIQSAKERLGLQAATTNRRSF